MRQRFAGAQRGCRQRLAYGALAPLLLRDFVLPDSAAFWVGLIASAVLGGTALLYFALFLLESSRGRQTALLPLTLFCMSPVFGHLSSIFAFPLRLELTRIAGHILAASGNDVTASGNLIRSGGLDFSVDPACMGLHMLQCALLSMMMIGLFRQRYGRRLPGYLTGCALAVCVAVNIGSNLLRIVIPVLFRLAPGTAMHELVGILCLAGYVLLPCGLLIRWLTLRYGLPERPVTVTPLRNTSLLHVSVLAALAAGLVANPPKWDRTGRLPRIPGYEASRADAGEPGQCGDLPEGPAGLLCVGASSDALLDRQRLPVPGCAAGPDRGAAGDARHPGAGRPAVRLCLVVRQRGGHSREPAGAGMRS